MRHLLSALVHNQPGVLAHIAGMLASRSFNIESLAVGETEDPQFSRMTFVVRGADEQLNQVRKQLEKVVSVVRVDDLSKQRFIARDLMLLTVTCPPERRVEVRQVAEIFHARVVDVGGETLTVEISGKESKVQAFVELMRPYGIVELARSGRIALARGSMPSSADAD